jgi:hypothetical protein
VHGRTVNTTENQQNQAKTVAIVPLPDVDVVISKLEMLFSLTFIQTPIIIFTVYE